MRCDSPLLTRLWPPPCVGLAEKIFYAELPADRFRRAKVAEEFGIRSFGLLPMANGVRIESATLPLCHTPCVPTTRPFNELRPICTQACPTRQA